MIKDIEIDSARSAYIYILISICHKRENFLQQGVPNFVKYIVGTYIFIKALLIFL